MHMDISRFLASNIMSIENITNAVLKKSDSFLKEIIFDDKNKDDNFEVSVFGNQKNVCVGIIDIIDSSKKVAKMPINKSAIYYEIFINHMAKIINQFKGKVLKTMGDGILFYFPETKNSKKESNFMNCIETGLVMCESHEILTDKLLDEFLPLINFRISFDYGQVMTVKTGDWVLDLIGSTINICSKINHKCIKNEMVIGDDLYKQVKNVKEYKFNKNGECELNLKHSYQIHSVKRKSPKLKILN